MSRQLSSCNITQSALSSYSLDMTWTEWIFEESARRLCVFYQIVNMLVDFEPANLCKEQTDLILPRLPSSRRLWEATHEASWRKICQQQSGTEIAFGMDKKGELVRLSGDDWRYAHLTELNGDASSGTTPSRNEPRWEEWCSGMDSFGGLVMLAASLLL